MIKEEKTETDRYPELDLKPDLSKQLNYLVKKKFPGYPKTENFCLEQDIEYFSDYEKKNLITQVFTMSEKGDRNDQFNRLLSNVQRIRNKEGDRIFERETSL